MTKKLIKRQKLVKISIAKVVREIIEGDEHAYNALSRGFANLSALARTIKKDVETKIGTEVSLAAIISALKRIEKTGKSSLQESLKVLANSSISLRTNLAKISVKANEQSLDKITKIISMHMNSMIQISWSPTAYSLVFDQSLMPKMLSYFGNEALEKKSDLAAMVINSPPEIISTPGCVALITSKLSKKEINIEDVVSTYTYTLLVFKMEDIAEAFRSISDLIEESRKLLMR